MPHKDPETRRVYERRYFKKWRNENRDWFNKRARRNQRRARLKALQKVSKKEIPACAHCGCDNIKLLEFNHVNGGSTKEYHNKGPNIVNDINTGRRQIDDLEVTCKICNQLHYIKLKFGEAVSNHFVVRWQKSLSMNEPTNYRLSA